MSLLQRNRRITALSIFTVALVSRLGYWVYLGTALGNDTNDYTRVCSVWWADPFAAAFAHKGILYSGFTVPLCGVLSIPGASFDVWVALQIVTAAVGCVLVYRIGTVLVDVRAGIFAGLALAVLWDTFQWDVYVLSDSLFTFGVILVLWALTWHHKKPSRHSRLAVYTTMGYLLLSRPHGFPLVAGWVLYDLFPQDDPRRLDLFSNRIIPLMVAVGIVAAAPYAIQRYALLDIWQSGWIVINDQSYVYPFITESDAGPVEFILVNLHHLIAMALVKVVFFFSPLLPRHSLMHITINLVTYLPIVLVGFVGLARAWREDFHLFRIWATPVLVLAFVTAVTFVSWDLRYRAPLGPVFALAFGYAVTGIIDWVSWSPPDWLATRLRVD